MARPSNDLLAGLDNSQKRFCEAPPEHTRLLAPAGCGKTLSLLFRCMSLAQRAKVQKPRFLLVTFTVAARQELVSRINEDERFAPLRDQLEATTLNSWGFRRIKTVAYSPKLLTSKNDMFFAMKNQLQQVWMAHSQIRAVMEDKRTSNTAPRKLFNLINTFKSLGFDHTRHKTLAQFSQVVARLRDQGLDARLDEVINELTRLGVLGSIVNRQGVERVNAGDSALYQSFYKFWMEATTHLISSATFTLEDQKYFAYLDELQKVEEGRFLSGAARYDYVLVDEFQDINPLDLALVKAIADRNKASITIVGDDDQAIFEWRGATPEYILDPQKYFGVPFNTFTLAINYRSPRNIVERSQQLIARNRRRVNKEVRPNRIEDADIVVRSVAGLQESLDLVHQEVARTVNSGQSPSRIAIIGRKRSQIIPYQVFFASKGISFCAAEDLQVFMSDAFEELLSLLLIKSQVGVRLRVLTRTAERALL